MIISHILASIMIQCQEYGLHWVYDKDRIYFFFGLWNIISFWFRWKIFNIFFVKMYVVCKSCHQFFFFFHFNFFGATQESLLKWHFSQTLFRQWIQVFYVQICIIPPKKKLLQKNEEIKNLEISPKLVVEMNEFLRSNISQKWGTFLRFDSRLFFFFSPMNYY